MEVALHRMAVDSGSHLVPMTQILIQVNLPERIFAEEGLALVVECVRGELDMAYVAEELKFEDIEQEVLE